MEELINLISFQMEDIRRQGKLCDVNLRVGENVFTAHRIVLAATIPYFRSFHDLVFMQTWPCKNFPESAFYPKFFYSLISWQGHVHPRHGGGKAARYYDAQH